MEPLCPKCNKKLVKCIVPINNVNLLQAYKPPHKVLNKNRTNINAFICPNCGYVEWYAENPEVLK